MEKRCIACDRACPLYPDGYCQRCTGRLIAPVPAPITYPFNPPKPSPALPLPEEDQETPDEYPVLCFERDLDGVVALGLELARLRQAKETALKAAKSIYAKLIETKTLIDGVEHHQAYAAFNVLATALAEIKALLVELERGAE